MGFFDFVRELMGEGIDGDIARGIASQQTHLGNKKLTSRAQKNAARLQAHRDGGYRVDVDLHDGQISWDSRPSKKRK